MEGKENIEYKKLGDEEGLLLHPLANDKGGMNLSNSGTKSIAIVKDIITKLASKALKGEL